MASPQHAQVHLGWLKCPRHPAVGYGRSHKTELCPDGDPTLELGARPSLTLFGRSHVPAHSKIEHMGRTRQG